MKTSIHHILGKNKLQYLNEVTYQYNLWCEWLSSIFFVPTRELQLSPQLWSWFTEKWTVSVECTFLNQNQEFIKAGITNPKIYRLLFNDIMKDYGLFRTYPKPLLKKIKAAHYKTLQNNGKNLI